MLTFLPEELPEVQPSGIFLFKVAENWLNLSTLQTWISIRDNLTRTRLLATQLIEFEVIKQGQKVLVGGGGVSGINIAALLARRGAEVTVVDDGNKPFRLQRGCKTRYIDSYEYDWPRVSFSWTSYPDDALLKGNVTWNIPAPVLPTGVDANKDYFLTIAGAKPANLHVADWDRSFNAFRQDFTPPKFDFLGNTKLLDTAWSVKERKHVVTLRDTVGNRSEYKEFDFVITCFGQPPEPTTWTSYDRLQPLPLKLSKGFWENDTIRDPDLGLPSPGGQVLIIGLGDGALQDFMRCLAAPTVQTARDVIDLIESQFSGDPAAKLVWQKSVQRLWWAEEQALRAYPLYRFGADFADSIWKSLNRTYVQEVEQLFTDKATSGQMEHAFSAAIRRDLPSKISLLALTDSPTHAYGLNRFVFQFFKHGVEFVGGKLRFTPVIELIVSDKSSLEELAGNKYQLRIPAGVGKLGTYGPYDLIIIRTGPSGRSKPRPGTLAALREDIARAPMPFVACL